MDAITTRRTVLSVASLSAVAALAGCTKHTSAAPTTSDAPTSSPATSTGESGSSAPSSSPSSTATLTSLAKRLSGKLVLPSAAGYAGASRLYNPRFDGAAKPSGVAQCRNTADVAACVGFAASSGSKFAIRSGGHSYGGWSANDGLLIDVGGLSGVTVDAGAKTARIGAGARLIDVYTALAAKGVAIAGGSCPTVGLTGLLLGGGVGVLSRAYGLTCDALQSATVVTADGKTRTVDAKSDADLFWALRGGGGGSFGAVTELTLAVRPAPTVHTFFLQWEFAHAAAVLTAWQQWIGKADPSLWSTCKLLADPTNGGLRVTVSGTWIGAASALTPALAPLLSAVGAAPSGNTMNTLDYAAAMLLEAGCSGKTAAQCETTALGHAARQPFAATSAILDSPLPAAGIAVAVAQVQAAMSVPALVEGGVSFDALGGKVAGVAPGATAFVHRQALASVQYTATWAPAGASGKVADAAPFDRYVRGERSALSRWTGTGAYVNYADSSIANYPQAYWGANYARLQSVKKQYDPHNLFTFAQAVKA